MPDAPLTPLQLERYARHLRLSEVGPAGQAKLLRSKVLVVGVGGLGSPAALYLAAAGVGTLGLVDDDRVSLSNLQRQVLFGAQDVGQLKVEAARRRLFALNPEAHVVTHPVRLSPTNALQIVGGYDLVVNGSDNFPTRYLLSDACVLLDKPLVDASAVGFTGLVTAFLPRQGCYRCLFPAPPPPGTVPTCEEAGVLGALVGQLGSLEALEAVKLLLGIGESLAGRLLLVDALAAETQAVHWTRSPACPACGDEPEIHDLAAVDYPGLCGLTPTLGQTAGADLAGRVNLPPTEVAALLAQSRVRIVDVREPWEYSMHHIPGAELMPLPQFRLRVGSLSPDEDVVVVCEHGQRSALVTDALRQAGLMRVYNLEGGMARWLEEDLPVARGER
ncbi:MAG: molybdopterin-synthase adenylyltransferase MoeB [Symbiobacteriia bacterium]